MIAQGRSAVLIQKPIPLAHQAAHTLIGTHNKLMLTGKVCVVRALAIGTVLTRPGNVF